MDHLQHTTPAPAIMPLPAHAPSAKPPSAAKPPPFKPTTKPAAPAPAPAAVKYPSAPTEEDLMAMLGEEDDVELQRALLESMRGIN